MTNATVRAMRRDLHKLLTKAAKASELTVIRVIEEDTPPPFGEEPVTRRARMTNREFNHHYREEIAEARRRGDRIITLEDPTSSPA
jgi:hypothetical protein